MKRPGGACRTNCCGRSRMRRRRTAWAWWPARWSRRASAGTTSRGWARGNPAAVNRRAVSRTRAFIEAWRAGSAAASECPVILTGGIGPRGDGYAVSDAISAAAATDYQAAPQVETLAAAGVDLLLPLTMTSLPEDARVVRAAARAGLPVLVSPTIEPDRRLADGTPLGEFVTAVDQQTSGTPVGYMVNCVDPSHLAPVLGAAADAARPGGPGSSACAPTRRPRRTPSSTTAPRSIAAIRRPLGAGRRPAAGLRSPDRGRLLRHRRRAPGLHRLGLPLKLGRAPSRKSDCLTWLDCPGTGLHNGTLIPE